MAVASMFSQGKDGEQVQMAQETVPKPSLADFSTTQQPMSSGSSPTMPALEVASTATAGHAPLPDAVFPRTMAGADSDDSFGSKTFSETTQTTNHDPFVPQQLADAAKKLWDNGPQEKAKVTKPRATDGSEEIINEAMDFMDMFQAPKGMVEVTIPSGKTFYLHIGVLSDKCDYFRAALTGGFQEASTKSLTLKDVSDNTFAFFLKWLYGGTIQPDRNPNPKTCPFHQEANLTWAGLIDLWFFADYLCTAALQNHVVDNIVYKMSNFYCHSNEDRSKQVVDAIKLLWKPKVRTDLGLLPSAKPLCDLLLDFVANPTYMPKGVATKTIKVLPAAFIREYALRSVERSFEIRDQTDCLFQTTALHGHNCGCGCNPDLYDSDMDDIFEKLEMTEAGVEDLVKVWKIEAEKYHVKEAKEHRK